MTIDEFQEACDDIRSELYEMVNELEGKDLSDLSSIHQHYIQQALKSMRLAGSAAEEAASYLTLD